MKLLVFAHTPPPHHGQSYMVQLMLDGFGGDHWRHPQRATNTPHDIKCFHVNARVSESLQDIGHVRPTKLLLLIKYCLQAIWCRFRHGVTTFYYVPAPGKRSALLRDWLVLLLCRPFFPRTVLHWHAAGLGKWLEREAQMNTRSWTFRAFKHADLSMVLSNFNRLDAEKFLARKVEKVPNGIPDPCANFATEVLPRRRARTAVRQQLLAGETPSDADLALAGANPEVIEVLFLGHCMRSKGLFDALATVDLANDYYRRHSLPLRVHLTVAGEFVDATERAEFERCNQPKHGRVNATYRGFISGAAKQKALAESDCMCFPSFYAAESFGLVLVEAMAFGLPIVTTRWRSLPELFPTDYPGLVDVRRPDQAAQALHTLMISATGENLRALFLQNFTVDRFLLNLAAALHRLP